MKKIHKIILLGDTNTGKTSYVKRLMGTSWIPQPTEIPETTPFHYCLDWLFWDGPSDTKEGYYLGATAAFILFDVTKEDTAKRVAFWYARFRKVQPRAPVVVLINKTDLPGKRYTGYIPHEHHVTYIAISVKDNHNLYKPLDHLVKILKN